MTDLAYINTLAPDHDKTSCSDAHAINGRYSSTDFGGCYRCTLLSAAEDLDLCAPEHERTSCSDEHPVNARFEEGDLGGCYRCTLIAAAAAA
jgi:hypothetical protein